MDKTQKKEAVSKKRKEGFQLGLIELAEMKPFDRIPTGITPIDMPTVGGIPRGTITLLSGVEGSGKSTLAARTIAGFNIQYPQLKCLYVSAENKLDPEWAIANGVDKTKVTVSQPANTEEAQYIVGVMATQRQDIGLVVVDSLASLSPEKEYDGDPTDEFMAIAARLNNKFIRKLTSLQLRRVQLNNPLTIILINQERESMQMYSGAVLPGGKQQRFNCALWIKFLKSNYRNYKSGPIDIAITTTLRFQFNKNGGAPPNPKAAGEVEMCIAPFGDRKPGQVLDGEFIFVWAQEFGLIKGAGSQGFSYKGEKAKKDEWIERWQAVSSPEREAIRKELIDAYNAWRKGEGVDITLRDTNKKDAEGGIETYEELGEVGE